MAGNYGTAAISGLLDLGGPIGKGVGLAAAPVMGAIRAYHGSPHKFDKFDMSKIGTGEGAQAYGHGLYFAESPQVAKEYQKNISGDVFKVGDKVFDPSQIGHLNVRSLVRKGDLSGAIEKASTIAKSDSPVADVAKKDLEVLKQINSLGGLQKTSGNLYEVNLRWPGAREATDPLGPQHFLDYDRPLSQQSEFVQNALAKIDKDTYHPSGDDYSPEELGQMIYMRLANSPLAKSQAEASSVLKQIGIPGIRYLDAGSRSSGGTSNYVTFDDQLAEILRRNLGLLE
jgi:hypothetical protein